MSNVYLLMIDKGVKRWNKANLLVISLPVPGTREPGGGTGRSSAAAPPRSSPELSVSRQNLCHFFLFFPARVRRGGPGEQQGKLRGAVSPVLSAESQRGAESGDSWVTRRRHHHHRYTQQFSADSAAAPRAKLPLGTLACVPAAATPSRSAVSR